MLIFDERFLVAHAHAAGARQFGSVGQGGELRLERPVGVLGAGRNPARGQANGDPRHDRSPFWYFLTIFTAADGLRLPKVALADHQDRRQRAAPEARHGLDRKQPIGCRLAVRNAEVLLDRLAQLDRPADVARGAMADAKEVLANRLQPELRVEGRHPVDLGQRIPDSRWISSRRSRRR